MKGRLKCGLFALLYAVSSIVSLGAFSNNVSAVSDYDNSYKLTDNLYVYADRPQQGYSCTDIVDISTRWESILSEDDAYSDYLIAKENGLVNVFNVYRRIVYSGNTDEYTQVTISWKKSNGYYLYWTEEGVTIHDDPQVNDWGYATIGYDSNCDITVNSGINVNESGSPISTSDGDLIYDAIQGNVSIESDYAVANYFIKGDWEHPDNSLNIPIDYEGDEIATVIRNGEILIFPNITVEVSDKRVSIMSKRHELITDDYHVYFFITNATFDGGQPETQFGMSGYLEPDMWETFDVPEYGLYAIEALFAGTDNEQSSFVPPEGYKAVQNGTLIDVQGGFFGVNTDDMVCEQSPTSSAFSCSYPSLEDSLFDCSPVALDGCFKNIMFYIADWLGFPLHAGSPMAGQISRYRSETFGLMPIIDAPISVFQRMATHNHSCAPLVLDMSHFGNITVPCISTVFQRSGLAPFYTVYQTIINGAVSYWVIVGLFRMVKDFQNPANDRIEVAQL